MNEELNNLKEFHTDETVECYKSIEFVYEQLLKCKQDSYNWKWAIIGVHNALQNCMVYTLNGTDIIKNIKKNSKPEKFEEKLNNFLDLYKNIKGNNMLKYGDFNNKKYIPEVNDDNIIKRLNDTRNIFIHYIPSGFGEYTYEFLDMFFVAIKIINFLVEETMAFNFFKESEFTIKLLGKIQNFLVVYKKELKPDIS
jgi:hypothetical protein